MKGLVDAAEREFETARRLGPGGPARMWRSQWRGCSLATRGERWTCSERVSRPELVRPWCRICLASLLCAPALMLRHRRRGGHRRVRGRDQAGSDARGPATELGKALLGAVTPKRRSSSWSGRRRRSIRQPRAAVSARADLSQDGEYPRAQELLARVTKLNEQGRSEDPDRN